MENSLKGIIYALISTASWAVCSIIFKKLGERLDPISMTAIKAILSALFLFIVINCLGINIFISSEQLMLIMLSGIIGIFIGDSLFFASLNRLSPMMISLLLFAGPDIFSGIFGIIFLGEMPSLIVWLGILLTMIGLGLFIFPIKNDNTAAKTTFIGIIFALLSLICTSYSMVIIKPILKDVHIITATMYRMLFSGIISILFVLLSGRLKIWKSALSDKVYDLKLLGTISIVTFGGFLLSLSAIKYCDLVAASAIMSLEPLFIMIFMILFYKYKPKLREVFGILSSIVGIIVITVG